MVGKIRKARKNSINAFNVNFYPPDPHFHFHFHFYCTYDINGLGQVSGMGRSVGFTPLECFGLCLQFSLSYNRSSVPLTFTPNASSLTGCFRSLFLSQSSSSFCRSETRSADSFLNKKD